jgi:hypothetical protein
MYRKPQDCLFYKYQSLESRSFQLRLFVYSICLFLYWNLEVFNFALSFILCLNLYGISKFSTSPFRLFNLFISLLESRSFQLRPFVYSKCLFLYLNLEVENFAFSGIIQNILIYFYFFSSILKYFYFFCILFMDKSSF